MFQLSSAWWRYGLICSNCRHEVSYKRHVGGSVILISNVANRHHSSSIDQRYQINLSAPRVGTRSTYLLSFERDAVIKSAADLPALVHH